MLNWWVRFASAQSWEETQRQYSVSSPIEAQGRYITLIGYGVALAFLPFWICILLAAIDTFVETRATRILSDIDPPNEPGRYFSMFVYLAFAHASFGLMCVLVYQGENPLAKAFAVGALAMSLMQLATVRTVHLPLALLGLGVFSTLVLVGNGYYWVSLGDARGLAISTIAALAAIYFCALTMLSVHRLHSMMMRDRFAAMAGDRAKSRFLAQMSHELRTPLNAILGMGSAELQLSKDTQSRDRLTIMLDSARSLSILLDDILDMSAAQAGALPIRPMAAQLPREIGSVAELFRHQIESARLRFLVSFAPNLPEFVVIDAQRLRQCLSNLLSNAIKFTREGDIQLQVYLKEPNLLAIQITDTGPGVPDIVRSQIFQPFHRGQSDVAGTGLGLSISRTLARRMGGDLILLPSTIGASFLLTFTIEPAHEADVAMEPPASLAQLRGIKALVVDDVSTNRLVASTHLRLHGAETAEAESGAAALTLASQWQPDVVLLDVLMPDMDGLETLKHLRALPGKEAATAVIAMTADATEERGAYYLASGFDGFLAKPISTARLIAAIQGALGQRKT